MVTSHMSIRASSPSNTAFKSLDTRTATSYERELVRLREALAQEAALLHQRDELIRKLLAWRETAASRVAALTPRQRQIMGLVLAGHPSKNIAVDLGIAKRTVENHRASIMRKTGSTSIPALARLAFAAAWNSAEESDPLDQLRQIIDRERRFSSSRSTTSDPIRSRKPHGAQASGWRSGPRKVIGLVVRRDLAQHRSAGTEGSRFQGCKQFADRARKQENCR